MAEFQEVMRQWRRMCKAYTTDDESCCKGCPVVDFQEYECGCGAIFEMADSIDWKKYADAIMAWAAEHNEPVYPTWYEVMAKLGVIDGRLGDKTLGEHVIEGLIHHRIPADIAQKLWIEPKEG